MEALRRLASGLWRRVEPDGIDGRNREIASALPDISCVHGVGGAWLTPLLCRDCRAVIDASNAAARRRERAVLEEQFVRAVRDELRRLEAVRPTRPPRGAPFDGLPR